MMAELLELLRQVSPPQDVPSSALTLRDALQLAHLGYSLAAIAAPPLPAEGPYLPPLSADDNRIFKVSSLHALNTWSCAILGGRGVC